MRKLILALVGIALLGFGGYRQFAAPAVSADDKARCESIVRDRYADAESQNAFLPKCGEPGAVAMMDAQASDDSAQDAAARIAAANQGDLSNHLLDWALIGMGLVLVAGAALPFKRRA